jgi:hypothetical protein
MRHTQWIHNQQWDIHSGIIISNDTHIVLSGVRVTRSLGLCLCFVDRCLSFCIHEKYQRDSLIYWYLGKKTTPLKPFFSFILFNFFQQEIINIAFLVGSVLLIFLVFCVVLLCLYILNSVLWYLLRFPQKKKRKEIWFLFTYSCL